MSLETVGTTLDEWMDGVERATMRLGERLAEDALERYRHNVEINTPVETGALRSSYRVSDVRYGQELRMTGLAVGYSVYAWTGSVYTEIEYAEYVERGTGLWGPEHKKYVIKPKQPGGVLAFSPYMKKAGGVVMDVAGHPASGGPVVVRYVMHPGSPGAAMFRIGAVITEAETEEWSHRALSEWRRDAERPEALLSVSAGVQWRGGGLD